jgi:hypothetical protein
MPELIEIDLSKTTRQPGAGLEVNGPQYLCQIRGRLFVGQFELLWYGLFFRNWHGVGIQFDPPGTNLSRWERVWRIDGLEQASSVHTS